MFWFLSTALAAPVEIALEAPAAVSVEVTVQCGTVKVVGSDRGNVRISGTAGRADQLTATREGSRVVIEADEERGHECVALLIEAPERASLELESISATVEVSGLRGGLEVATISGSVTVTGSQSIDIASISGSIVVSGPTTDVEVANVSGSIRVTGGGGELEAATVSGAIDVIGERPYADVELAAVSGRIVADLSLSPGGSIEAETHSGQLRVLLPAQTDAALSLETFSGRINNAFGPKDQSILGSGAGRVELSSFSGTVSLERK